jgi:hypothetical protein
VHEISLCSSGGFAIGIRIATTKHSQRHSRTHASTLRISSSFTTALNMILVLFDKESHCRGLFVMVSIHY